MRPNVYEPAEDKVHAPPHPTADSVTLCGLTDTIGLPEEQQTEDTDEPIDCLECRSIVDWAAKLRRAKR